MVDELHAWQGLHSAGPEETDKYGRLAASQTGCAFSVVNRIQ